MVEDGKQLNPLRAAIKDRRMLLGATLLFMGMTAFTVFEVVTGEVSLPGWLFVAGTASEGAFTALSGIVTALQHKEVKRLRRIRFDNK